jgi:type II secretory pathway component PulK
VNKFAYGHGERSFAKMERLRFGMIDEESKINLNLITNVDILTRLFQAATKLGSDEARNMAEAVMDFKDPDDSAYAGGAEGRYYRSLSPPYEPKNANIDTLEELLWVKGITPAILAKIKPHLTLHSSGKINVNTAPYATLVAIGFGGTLALKILEYRDGPDRTLDTRDDGFFSDLSAMAPALEASSGLEEAQKALLNRILLEGQITVASEYFQIQSVGKIENRQESMVIQCVVERYGEILQWREFYVTSAS